jgi:hypothetical protein
MLFCVAWHFTALRSWFCNDDFAWLSLPLLVNSWHDLLHVLFAPMAQGTIRIFSERLFFLTLGSIFDLDIVPFKIVVFLTQFANLALLMSIVRRLTGSALAGFLAPILWCAGIALAEPLAWSSAYNEVLVSFCFLLGFFFRLKWIETGERRFRYLEWLPFLFGFGVLETIVIYPALVMLYAICCAPKTARITLPLFVPAVAFAVFHFLTIPPSSDLRYQLVFRPANILSTLWTYWAMAAGTLRLALPETLPVILLIAVSAALALWVAFELYRGQRLALFLLLWFPLTLSPVLPLDKHISDYYLAVPTLGLATLAAWAAAAALRVGQNGILRRLGKPPQRRVNNPPQVDNLPHTGSSWLKPVPLTAALLLVPAYLYCSFDAVHAAELTRFERGRDMRHLVRGMEPFENQTEGKFVFLQNVSEDLFFAGLLDRPLNLIGMSRVYVAPGSALPAWLHSEYPEINNYEISWQDAYDLVTHGRAAVFSVAGQPEDTTASFLKNLAVYQAMRGADIINVADPQAASRLGDGWYPVEGTTRWTKREASLWMESSLPGQHLSIRGFCPQQLLAAGPIELIVEVEGKPVAKHAIKESNWFTFDVPLPEHISGKGRVNIHLRVSRAYQAPNDSRELGLLFATFSVQK